MCVGGLWKRGLATCVRWNAAGPRLCVRCVRCGGGCETYAPAHLCVCVCVCVVCRVCTANGIAQKHAVIGFAREQCEQEVGVLPLHTWCNRDGMYSYVYVVVSMMTSIYTSGGPEELCSYVG